MTTTYAPSPDDLNFLSDLVALALGNGASEADAMLIRSSDLNVSVRNGATESVERSESAEFGLRVLKGKKQGIISTTDMRPEGLAELVDRALRIADSTPDDDFIGLASSDQLARDFAGTQAALEMCDAAMPSPEDLLSRALTCEAAALAVDGVTNSQGGSADWGRTEVTLFASNGFSGQYARSGHGVSTVVLAGEGTAMERDYDYDNVVHLADLRDPVEIGRKAGERTVRRLNPRVMKSQQVPVIIDRRVASEFLGIFCSAINGSTVARGASFLKDRMGEAVFPHGITIVDDPFVPRGMRSKPFDAEGLTPQRRALVDEGRLTGWVLDLRSARKLGLSPTGNGARGLSSPPSPSVSNVWMENGSASVGEMIADIKQGFLLLDTLGHDLDLVTGDFSRGASGLWIENGKVAFPVSGLTIAGNLADMFKAMTPANDLDRRYGMDCPTLRINGMTVAGE